MSEEITLDETPGSDSKLPSFLLVLLILTSLNVGYNVATGLFAMGAQESTENLQEEMYEAIESSGADMSDLPGNVMEALDEFVGKISENAAAYQWFELFYYLLIGASVYFMYKRMKKGLQLYTAVQLIGAFSFLFFFGSNFITIGITVFFLIGAIIWILLYRANRSVLS